MQVVSTSTPADKLHGDDRFAELSGKLIEDFGSKLKMEGGEEEEKRRDPEKSWRERDESDEDGEEEDKTDDGDEEEEEEEEFSFLCADSEGSPITADEAFQDGQIRRIFPLFNRDILFAGGKSDTNNDTVSGSKDKSHLLRLPLKKLFVEDRDGGDTATTSDSDPQGPYCSWSGRTVADASPESWKKSNSTGFSKIWRFRDLVMRSNSDGKDAFVFLNNNVRNQSSSATTANKKKTKKERAKKRKEEASALSSAHERHYVMNRAMKEEGKRKSYLPYKQVGFFANVNGLSRNIHPF